MQPERLSIGDFVADPDKFIVAARREGCPFSHTDAGPMAISHDAVRALVQSKELRPAFSRVLELWGVRSGPFHDWMARSPLDMEGEPHKNWRRLLARVFTPQSVERLRPRIRAEANALVDSFAGDGRCEFIDAYARVLPALGLCELIGVPVNDRAVFGGWADTVGLGFNLMLAASRIDEIDAAITALLDYAGSLVEARRIDPLDDFITRLVQAVDADATIPSDLLKPTIAGLVFAGHETTKNQLGWMVAMLSEVPEEWERVARDPARARAVVEEVLRFRSAATSVSRLALEDVELLGHSFPAGTSIIGSLWAANRDPAEFGKPDTFDVDANAGGFHMAFGQGPHHCLGAALARLELQESLIALASRLTGVQVEPGATFLPPIGINGPSRLPIVFSRR